MKLLGLSAATVILPSSLRGAETVKSPNIVLIYADDLGYGDVGCYGATKVRTPNIDRIAAEGIRFTHAHSPAATCTPSRYALLTGEYAWRKKGTGILPGDARLIIQPGRTTLPSMLQKAGYATGAVGKWHLGLGSGDLDWNTDIAPGPLDIGFDYCFILPATGDRVPCVYVENRRVVGLDPADPLRVGYDKPVGDEPTGKDHPELLKMHPSHGHDQTIVNGISRIGTMSGGKSARWVDEDMADTLTGKAKSFIDKNKDRPFFLYFATHDIHVPRVPNPRFVGATGMGPRGDVIAQLDFCVGEILQTLERLKLADNTLVLFTSDNGPVVDDGYKDQAVEKLGDHKPAGPLRGGKYSIFDGGTRVPFLVRWPAASNPASPTPWLVRSICWRALRPCRIAPWPRTTPPTASISSPRCWAKTLLAATPSSNRPASCPSSRATGNISSRAKPPRSTPTPAPKWEMPPPGNCIISRPTSAKKQMSPRTIPKRSSNSPAS